MGFRLYIDEAETGKEIFCGGKIYGYDTPSECNFCGAFWLYYNCSEFKEDVDWNIENHFPLTEYSLAEIFDLTFSCRPDFEYKVTADIVRGFIKEYMKDWAAHFRTDVGEYERHHGKITVEDGKLYLIKWF